MTISAPEKKEEPIYKEYSSTATQEIRLAETAFYLSAKRAIDVIGAFSGIIVLLPLLLLVGILIKIEDFKGPILFRQKRVGKNGSTFYMYKFRSMVCNAEELKASLIQQNEVSGPVFKIKKDPRVTNVGKFIRRTSIDELPQLFNVLKGEMSLVGPRPALPDEVDMYTSYERQRLCVIPGLTCYWQVSGRSNISFADWVEMDLKYIRQRTILIDLKLIFRTVLVLFGSKDAF